MYVIFFFFSSILVVCICTLYTGDMVCMDNIRERLLYFSCTFPLTLYFHNITRVCCWNIKRYSIILCLAVHRPVRRYENVTFIAHNHENISACTAYDDDAKSSVVFKKDFLFLFRVVSHFIHTCDVCVFQRIEISKVQSIMYFICTRVHIQGKREYKEGEKAILRRNYSFNMKPVQNVKGETRPRNVQARCTTLLTKLISS